VGFVKVGAVQAVIYLKHKWISVRTFLVDFQIWFKIVIMRLHIMLLNIRFS